MSKKTRAIALLSGGLDSVLAIKTLLNQDIDVVALTFVSVFSPGKNKAGELQAALAARELGVDLIVRDASEYMRNFVPKPKFGWGKHMNPCMDCRSTFLIQAKKMFAELGASFVVTGEVIGQRPMSQHLESIKRVEAHTGLDGLILRPLSAKLLDPTIPENSGLVERTKLHDISGRSRKAQFALAKQWGLRQFGSPAGGCLLTEAEFSWKLSDLLNFNDELTPLDTHLIKFGRHFRLSPTCRLILGRNERENAKVVAHRRPEDYLLVADSGRSPECLLKGASTEKEIALAASICAYYARYETEKATIIARPIVDDEKRIWISPRDLWRRIDAAKATKEQIAKYAIRRK